MSQPNPIQDSRITGRDAESIVQVFERLLVKALIVEALRSMKVELGVVWITLDCLLKAVCSRLVVLEGMEAAADAVEDAIVLGVVGVLVAVDDLQLLLVGDSEVLHGFLEPFEEVHAPAATVVAFRELGVVLDHFVEVFDGLLVVFDVLINLTTRQVYSLVVVYFLLDFGETF